MDNKQFLCRLRNIILAKLVASTAKFFEQHLGFFAPSESPSHFTQ